MIARTCQTTRRPLLLWLVRGGVGAALLVVAALAREPFIVIPAVLAALISFGGCPMCWTLGLIERACEPVTRKDRP